MLSWFKKHPVKTFVTLIIAMPLGLNLTGFGWGKGWMSDEEKIHLAIEYVALRGPNPNYLDDYFRHKMGDKAFYDSQRVSGGPEGSYETLYSTYYDPKIWVPIDGGGYTQKSNLNKDAIIAEFLKKNPNCCKTVGSKGHPIMMPDFLDRLFGQYADIVEVRYNAPFLDKKGKLIYLKDYAEYPIIKNSGYVLNSAPH